MTNTLSIFFPGYKKPVVSAFVWDSGTNSGSQEGSGTDNSGSGSSFDWTKLVNPLMSIFGPKQPEVIQAPPPPNYTGAIIAGVSILVIGVVVAVVVSKK